jgi:sugar-phosphatase
MQIESVELQCSAFLFDLDGVLVDSRAVVERVCRSWAQRHGLDPQQVLRIAHGRRTRDTVTALAPHLDLMEEVAWLDAAELADVDGLRLPHDNHGHRAPGHPGTLLIEA